MKNVFITLVLVLILGAAVFFIFKKIALTSPQSTPSNNEERSAEDINWDNKVDYLDVNLVKSVLGCKKTDPCWNKVIGKTVTGDNPIYSSDSDLNKDGVIDDKDVSLLGEQSLR